MTRTGEPPMPSASSCAWTNGTHSGELGSSTSAARGWMSHVALIASALPLSRNPSSGSSTGPNTSPNSHLRSNPVTVVEPWIPPRVKILNVSPIATGRPAPISSVSSTHRSCSGSHSPSGPNGPTTTVGPLGAGTVAGVGVAGGSVVFAAAVVAGASVVVGAYVVVAATVV